MTNLNDLKSDMTNFVAAFNAWKNRIIEGLHEIINLVAQELEDMERDLGRIRTVAGLAMGFPGYAGKTVEMVSAVCFLLPYSSNKWKTADVLNPGWCECEDREPKKLRR